MNQQIEEIKNIKEIIKNNFFLFTIPILFSLDSIEHDVTKRTNRNMNSFFIKMYLSKIYLYYVINQYSYEKFCFNNFSDIIR